MNLTINGHHLEVTPALHNFVSEKLGRIKRHFSDQIVAANVILTVDNKKEKQLRQHAQCRIQIKGSEVFAENNHEDLYAAIDGLVDKLDGLVARHKERIKHHHHEAHKRKQTTD